MGSHFLQSSYPFHFTKSVETVKCQVTVITTSSYSLNLLREWISKSELTKIQLFPINHFSN